MNEFENTPIAVETVGIGYQPWHKHENATEVILVLQGTVQETMSCVESTLHKGDVAVLNRDTFHSLRGLDDVNIILSIKFEISYFEQIFQYIRYVVFILESHQRSLEEYEERIESIKEILCRIALLHQAREPGYQDKMIEKAKHLLDILMNNFSEIYYYNKNINPNSIKVERYYLIMRYLNQGFSEKTLLDDISKKEFFCKSYLSHLFKDVSTFGVNDIMCFVRNWKSEQMLLLTDNSITQISEDCGYSDPKYYYREFRKWYRCTPAEYRQKYKQELGQVGEFQSIPTESLLEEIRSYCQEWKNIVENRYCFVDLLDNPDSSSTPPMGSGLEPCIFIRFPEKPAEVWQKQLEECFSHDLEFKGPVKWQIWITYRTQEEYFQIEELIRNVSPGLPDMVEKISIIQEL